MLSSAAQNVGRTKQSAVYRGKELNIVNAHPCPSNPCFANQEVAACASGLTLLNVVSTEKNGELASRGFSRYVVELLS